MRNVEETVDSPHPPIILFGITSKPVSLADRLPLASDLTYPWRRRGHSRHGLSSTRAGTRRYLSTVLASFNTILTNMNHKIDRLFDGKPTVFTAGRTVRKKSNKSSGQKGPGRRGPVSRRQKMWHVRLMCIAHIAERWLPSIRSSCPQLENVINRGQISRAVGTSVRVPVNLEPFLHTSSKYDIYGYNASRTSSACTTTPGLDTSLGRTRLKSAIESDTPHLHGGYMNRALADCNFQGVLSELFLLNRVANDPRRN
ncbi:hypothetical protein J6590_052313 [Homalodisca vitripennis]|nr:hypothetical protein J6590_052313 [Homalodisca vitripennis]